MPAFFISAYVAECRAAPRGEGSKDELCPIDVITVLSSHCHAIARQNGIHFDIRCDVSAGEGDGKYEDISRVDMSDFDLCCLFSNLMENAVESCLRIKTGRRSIRVAIVHPGPDSLSICVWNSTDDNVQADGDTFLSA